MLKKKKLCIIGGGHGLSNILVSLQQFDNLYIISDVTDSGGSTGTIRKAFDCPAMGDIRKILTTLSNIELRKIFEYRIPQYKDCIGNLIMSSLIKIYSFNEAIKICHGLLGLKETHKVMPVSLDNFNICAEYYDGTTKTKEDELTYNDRIKEIWLDPVGKPNPEVLEAIKDSDCVIIAPGSLYTSIIANLLIPKICNEINKKDIIWIANLMQQFGETIGMDLQDHYNKLREYIEIDYAIINRTKPKERCLIERYEASLMPLLHLKDDKIKIIEEDLIDYDVKNSIVHHSLKVFNIIKEILS